MNVCLKAKTNKLYTKQKASDNPKDKRRYQQARSETQKMERQAYCQYIEDLIDIGDPHSDQQPPKQKRFWNYIKSLRKDNCGVSPLKDKGKLYSEPIDKATIFNKQYQSVFTKENNSTIPTPEGNPSPSMPDKVITTEGILTLLRKLNPKKATGPDMMPARILKEMADQCAQYLCILYRKCFSNGEIPDVWKTANVSAIFKKGRDSRRAITDLQHIIVSNIMRHLDKHDILTDCQHGFRRRRSCETDTY